MFLYVIIGLALMAAISYLFLINEIKKENNKIDLKESKKTLYKEDIRSPWRVL